MAREHVPVPQRDFYLEMPAGDIRDGGSGTDEEEGKKMFFCWFRICLSLSFFFLLFCLFFSSYV